MQGGYGGRPTGITILAILAALGGIFGVLGGLTLLGLGSFFFAASGLGSLAVIFGVVVLAIGLAELYFAYGAWTLQTWAWRIGILLQVINVVWAVIEVVTGYAQISGVIVSVVVSAIILWYLNSADVRRAFGAPATGWPWIGGA